MNLSLITATYHRPDKLAAHALPSVLKQQDTCFEWIVVNDGGDLPTRDLIQQMKSDISVRYLEIEHPRQGFGLCHARNAALEVASGDIISYLDDDNELVPEFVANTKCFFRDHPSIRAIVPKQLRRRDIVQNGQILRRGEPFISPPAESTILDFVVQRALFDSNGFAHHQINAPMWNPDFKVFCDYEYLLQCLGQWETEAFALASLIQVIYTQTSEGVIGRSTYQEWANELTLICDRAQHYSVLTQDALTTLRMAVSRWQQKHIQQSSISAFFHSLKTKRYLMEELSYGNK